jgi:hypothetical protein
VATLVEDVPAVDATPVRWDGRWWLLYTTQPYDKAALSVRYADDLTGPWRPHEANPVLTDVRGARPAGTPVVVDGDRYRPAQDCAGGYGSRVVLKRVRTLTPTRFDEERVGVVAPRDGGPYPEGLHTLSTGVGPGSPDVTLIDGKRSLRTADVYRRRARRVLDRLRDRS